MHGPVRQPPRNHGNNLLPRDLAAGGGRRVDRAGEGVAVKTPLPNSTTTSLRLLVLEVVKMTRRRQIHTTLLWKAVQATPAVETSVSGLLCRGVRHAFVCMDVASQLALRCTT
ncbi:hypothetical protein DPEC_G00051490 [Dallia pectoralis]|uniref:Uncharacterized protein n=1 Tax=Dallia pectoralis TaxID=75939 RepID=A0ACC2HCQ2_DALPE|nr:hypothetical protein DPEC_G00051490 [Dallia pectoralis]